MRQRILSPFLVGMSSIILQIACLRKLLNYFSGNELTIGIIMCMWLSGAGIGSYLGRHSRWFGRSFLLTGIFSLLIVMALYVIRHFYTPGEDLSLFSVIIITSLVILPISIISGAQFPMAIFYTGEPQVVFITESAGAFLGGMIFTFLLTETFDTTTIILMTGISGIIIASVILKKWLPLLMIPLLLIIIASGNYLRRYEWKGFEYIDSYESRYGEITLIRASGEYSIFYSGKYLFSYPDIYYEELRGVIPMLLSPASEDILVIGGQPSLLKWYLRFPVRNVIYLEHDSVMLDVLMKILQEDDKRAFYDKRIRMVVDDERKYIKESSDKSFDLVVINLPLPLNANMNRFYTEEFFYLLKNVLKNDGIVVMNFGTSTGYISRGLKMANGSIYRTLMKVFGHVVASSEEYGLFIVSLKEFNVESRVIKDRLKGSGINTRFLNESVIDDIFNPFRMEIVKKRLGDVMIINTDEKPVSYLYNLAIWLETGGVSSSILLSLRRSTIILPIVFLFIILCFMMRKQKESFLIFTTGYAGMSISISIILMYQTEFGYIYEKIGLISALYMSGLAIGSFIAKFTDSSLRNILLTDLSLFLIAIISPFILANELSFYFLITFIGIAGGLQFVMASSSLLKNRGQDAFARLYAFDLFGSTIGSIMTAVVIVPITGIFYAFLLFSMVKLISLCLLMSGLKG